MDIAQDQAPGPSFVREESVLLRAAAAGGGASVRLGMSRPSIMDDGWWLTTMWATGPAEAPGVIQAVSIAPLDGPPPEPPLAVMGPIFAGALAGLLDQEDGRQLIRLRMPAAQDAARPWRRPLILWLAVRWDPVRSAVMRPDELARELLRAFARGVEAAGRPG